MPRIIFIIGQSGAGKDTLATSLTKLFEEKSGSTISFSSGDEVRKFGQSGTYTAKLFRENNQKGKLAPWFALIGAHFNKINNEFTGDENIIWNGSPRTPREFEINSQMVGFYGLKADLIHLKVPDEECLRRIIERQKLENREETTNPQAINNKLKFFYEAVLPAIELARKDENYTVHEIDGSGTKEEVFERVKKALNI